VKLSLSKALAAIEGLFTSGKAQAAIQQAASLVEIALPIVQDLDALAPNRTTEQVIAAAKTLLATEKSLQPILTQAQTSPTGALLSLATALLEKNLPAAKAGVATNVLNTAVQLAVTAAHA